MAFQMERLAARSDADLAVYHLPAVTPARGIVLLCHGLAEHARRYHDFAVALSGNGFHVYANDHRGHGTTRSPGQLQGRFAAKDGPALVLGDVADVRNLAVSRHPSLPVILFGHSMGGLIALNAAETDPELYDALAVWNTNVHPGLPGTFGLGVLAVERMLKGSDVPSAALSRMTFGEWARAIPNRRTDLDWLSRDAAAVDAYIADPLCGFDVTVSLWTDLRRMSFEAARARRLARLPRTLPVHLVGGGKDPATRSGEEILWLARRMRGAGLLDVTATVYTDARHETLNDLGREAATADFLAWCRRVSDRTGAGPL
jgi:alpha-beta hydrolase superfamily lysophospholipase